MKNTRYNKTTSLAIKAQRQLEVNNNSAAFLSILDNPKIKQIANFSIAQNQNGLTGQLITPDEAKKMTPTILYQLLKNYNSEKAELETYLSRYLPFKLKKMSRKSKSEIEIEALQIYSLSPRYYKAKEEIQSPKDVSEASKFVPSTYRLLRQKRLENASFRNPEISFAEKRKHEIQKDIRQKLLASIKDIKDPVERIFKTTWLHCIMGKEKRCSPYVTKHDKVKIKPSHLIKIVSEKLRAVKIDFSEFDNLSQRGKYARIERYIEQIKKTFREVLADKDVPEWILKLGGTYWTQKLLNQAV